MPTSVSIREKYPIIDEGKTQLIEISLNEKNDFFQSEIMDPTMAYQNIKKSKHHKACIIKLPKDVFITYDLKRDQEVFVSMWMGKH